MYYALQFNEDTFEASFLNGLPDIPSRDLMSDEPLVLDELGVELLFEEAGTPSDALKVGVMFFVSQKLRRIFDYFNVDAEYYKVKAYSSDRSEVYNYYYMHFLDDVSCIDREKSDIDLEGDYVLRIRNLVIDESVVPEGRHFFRVGGAFKWIVLASDELKIKMFQESTVGLDFVMPSDWKW
jgi:hypothetical protein